MVKLIKNQCFAFIFLKIECSLYGIFQIERCVAEELEQKEIGGLLF